MGVFPVFGSEKYQGDVKVTVKNSPGKAEISRACESHRREFAPEVGVNFRIQDELLLPWRGRNDVSVRRVAKILNCSICTIQRMCESGELKAYKMREGKTSSPWRISFDSVVELAKKLHENNALPKRF